MKDTTKLIVLKLVLVALLAYPAWVLWRWVL
jgi:hypothetical protein